MMILVRNMEKTSKFHNFFNFQQKSRDTFVLRRLKVNLILTSLAFCYQFFSSFCLLFFLGDFWWICWAGHNIKHFLSNSVGSADLPEHAVETKCLQFILAWIPSKSQTVKRKVADCWVEISRNVKDLSRPALKNSQDPLFCHNFIFSFFSSPIFEISFKSFFKFFVSNLKRKDNLAGDGSVRKFCFLFWGILKENLESENWKMRSEKSKFLDTRRKKKKL